MADETSIDREATADDERLADQKLGKVSETLKGIYEVGQEIHTWLQYETHPFFVQVSNYTDVSLFTDMDLGDSMKNNRKVELITLPPVIAAHSSAAAAFERDEHDAGERSSFQFNIKVGHFNRSFALFWFRAIISFNVAQDEHDEEGHWFLKGELYQNQKLIRHDNIRPRYPSGSFAVSGLPAVVLVAMPTVYKAAKFHIAVYPETRV